MLVAEFFSEFLKLIHYYKDVSVIHSEFNSARITFWCHIMSPARMADLLYICAASNTPSTVDSKDLSSPGELPEDSLKKLIWRFYFPPDKNDQMELDGEMMPMRLFDFYTMVLRDLKNRNLINVQEIAHFEPYLKRVGLKLKKRVR